MALMPIITMAHKKEILLKIEFENHKLVFPLRYSDAKDRRICEAVAAHALNAVDILRGKRANNAMNSYRIMKEVENERRI